MAHTGFLHVPTAEDKEKSRLASLPDQTELSQEYLDVYNATIDVEEFGSTPASVASNTQSLYEDAILRTQKKSRGDTSKHVPLLGSTGDKDQIIAQNVAISESVYEDEIIRNQNKNLNLSSSKTIGEKNVSDGSIFSKNSTGSDDTKNVNGQTTTSNVKQSKKDLSLPTENPLHDYAPYNYIISLACMERQAFNTGQGKEKLIFKSGGKGIQAESGPLSKDYYVDSLVLRNTVAPTENSGAGSFYQILMNVTEPFGTSFLDALRVASNEMGYTNHLSAIYMLRIEFKGNNDEGLPTENIPFTTRDIPIKIAIADMNIQAGVTTYQITAYPAVYLGLTDLYARTQETVTCTGNTVGDLIDSFLKNYSIALSQLQTSNNLRVEISDKYALSRSESDPLINAEIGYNDTSSLSKVSTVSNLNPETARLGDAGSNKQVSVRKGTNIQAFIEAVVKNSRFYRDQLKSDGTPIGDSVKTMKLETKLQLGDDNGNGRNQYTFVYVLRQQEFSSDIIDPNKNLSSALRPIRTYDYLYTGNNKDVLNFNLVYQFAYYQKSPYMQDKGNKTVTDAANGNVEQNVEEGSKTSGSTKEEFSVEPYNEDESNFIPGINSENGQAVEIMQQIIQNPGADLIATNIELIGDPYWIPQKHVSNRSFVDSFTDTPNTDERGAVATDETQIVVEVNFKAPEDLDDESGLFKNLQDAQGFQGKYRVYACESRFEAGVFTNLLDMVRIKNQPKNTPSQIGQSANSLGADNYSYNPSTTIGQSANSLGADNYIYNPSTTIGQSANSLGSDFYTTGSTTNNVTRVPIGSNISKNKNAFVPEAFDIDFETEELSLPLPKIGIATGDELKKIKAQQELLDEIRKADQNRSSNRLVD